MWSENKFDKYLSQSAATMMAVELRSFRETKDCREKVMMYFKDSLRYEQDQRMPSDIRYWKPW